MKSAFDPFREFEDWFLDAKAQLGKSAEIAALGTVDSKKMPSVRMINYKGLKEGGFSFFTNFESEKGSAINENPVAALTFFWSYNRRQVRIRGRCDRLSIEMSDEYFLSRELSSQVTTTLSKQSRPFEGTYEDFLNQCTGLESTKPKLSRPKHWGGYVLLPTEIEFWEGGQARRHHRRRYRKNQNSWDVQELYPRKET